MTARINAIVSKLLVLDTLNIFITTCVVLLLKRHFLPSISLIFALLLGVLIFKIFESFVISYLSIKLGGK